MLRLWVICAVALAVTKAESQHQFASAAQYPGTRALTTDDGNSTDTSSVADGAGSSSTTEANDDASASSAASNTDSDPLTTSVDSTTETASQGDEDSSATNGDPSTGSSSTGSSKTIASSMGSRSSGGSTKLDEDSVDGSVAVTDSSTSSTTVNEADSSSTRASETSTTSSFTGKRKKSRVKITTAAPEPDSSSASSASGDASSSTGSIEETIAADTSSSGSSKPTPIAKVTSSVGAGTFVGIVVVGLVVGLLIIGSIFRRRTFDDDDIQSPDCRRSSEPYWGQTSPLNRQRRSQQRFSEQRFTDSVSPWHERASSGQARLWDDDIITTRRIPRDKVHVLQVISRGAFGEVYMGVYNQKPVAVKMLLPQMRGQIKQVNEFLAEAKMTATMEHPHIVSFIGVAWDSLLDVCMVLEYMGGGDLRSLLNNYGASRHPVGFDREKITIALHVCHALVYMHSLVPSIIHRDLKSRNILLNHAMEAKVVDFGISGERLDRTMTAGVGTSLWMAPEVMMGEMYDEMADIFSFGVVLSELDVHSLPYAKAMAANPAKGKMACAVMLQNVALGRLRVEFSQTGSRSMAELGRACVSVNPSERPTAAEMLYILQTILNQEFV